MLDFTKSPISEDAEATLKLWDVSTGKELRDFKYLSRVNSVGFSRDGRLAISGADDGTIRIWDAEKGRELAQMMATRDGEWLTITPEGFFSGARSRHGHARNCPRT